MFSHDQSAALRSAASPLLADAFEVSPRLKLSRKLAPTKAAGGAAFGLTLALGAAEAGAKTESILDSSGSFLNVGDQITQELADGAIEVTFANGEKIIIPAGEYGYASGDLFISEKFLSYDLAHAVLSPDQAESYVYSKGGDGGGVYPAGTATGVVPSTYTVVRPTFLTQATAAGVIVLAGGAAWYILTKIGDAPEFEYPIYTTSVEENVTGSIYTAIAKDLDSPDLVYSLRADTDEYDNEFFEIDSETGEVSFITPPNFEAPANDDENNVYNVKIDATDSDGGVGSMLLHVTVTDDATETPLTASSAADDISGTANADDVSLDSGAGTYTGTVSLGAGQDYLEVAASAVLGAATLSMGQDDDKVVIAQTSANTSTATIQLVGGNDVIDLTTENSGVYTISLGTGSDVVRISATSLTANPSVSLFTGDDKLDLSALDLSTIDATAYTTTGAATAALTGADVAYATTAGSDTFVYVDSDDDDVADITIQLLDLVDFSTDSIML